MNIVLLSGGSGKRLWPLSNDIRSKQFIKIFKMEDGSYESMVQRVYRQITKVDSAATVTIATSKTQVSAIYNQLGDNVGISIEPCRRDTFPAIALATAYLHDVQGIDENESVVVCPVDPYVEDDYFEAVKRLGELASSSNANLVLMGIEPTYPSEKYGYIIPKSEDPVSAVDTFKEKPDLETAKKYIAQNALWNGGVFAYKLKYVLDKAHELIDFTDYQDLFDKYETLTKISFDYAVVEKEDKIDVMRFHGQWMDLGTWNTLTESMEDNCIGNAMLDDACENVHVINELDVPVLCMGLKDIIVSASAEGILVSDKEQSSYIKPYVDGIEQEIMFAEKSWGKYEVLDVEDNSMTIKVTLNAKHSMNYHSHEHRDEMWTVISGTGKAIIDGLEQEVRAGDTLMMKAGCRHTIIAKTELQLIEVQMGKDINAQDKIKHSVHDTSEYRIRYEEWLNSPVFDEATKEELRSIAIDEVEIEDRFYRDLKFGTGGLRGVLGAGTNRMNIYTVTKATQGLADYIKSMGEDAMQKGVAIAYDSRHMSKEFAHQTALCLNANGIKTYLFDDLRPTPELSFAVRKLKCIAGVVITASHNPPEYNGYKVYWEDGGQIVAPHDRKIMEHVGKIHGFDEVLTMSYETAVSLNLYNMIPESVDEEYYEELMRQTIHSDIIPRVCDDMTIVYTPLHGTGNVPVQEVLKRLGFQNVYVVSEQEMPDGDFPTVSSPNPENPEGFAMALSLAKKVDADLILATDPDADRLGIYVKDSNGTFKGTSFADSKDYPYVCFNANMTGALMAEYVCRERNRVGTLPDNGAICSTIVTGNLAKAVAENYHLTFMETLTGFKYIGELIEKFEQIGSHKYVYGLEESYGCLVGDYTRDKDACGAVVMLCEVGAFYKYQNLTLCDAMMEMYEKYGYYMEGAHSVTLKGLDGADKIQAIMDGLRANPRREIAGVPVEAIRDYEKDTRLELATDTITATGLPKSNVLYYELSDNKWFAVRPSGTEPKIKFYFGVNEKSMQDAERKVQEMKRFAAWLVEG